MTTTYVLVRVLCDEFTGTFIQICKTYYSKKEADDVCYHLNDTIGFLFDRNPNPPLEELQVGFEILSYFDNALKSVNDIDFRCHYDVIPTEIK